MFLKEIVLRRELYHKTAGELAHKTTGKTTDLVLCFKKEKKKSNTRQAN